MANLILTDKCQRSCPYCFAKDYKGSGQEFTLEGFKKAVDFISTEFKGVNILGGEPTLHKDFVEMLNYLILNDFLIQVFTNGMTSKKVLERIKKLLGSSVLREDQLSFSVNINEEKYRSEGEFELQKNFFNVFGNITYLSFTIQDANTDLTFLDDIIKFYGLYPTIRLGLALPIFNSNNKYLPIDEYREVAKNIIHLANHSPGTTITFDCGFPLCMFELSEIKELNQNPENSFDFICSAVIDIYPDLTAINCFPLHKVYKTHIDYFNNISELRQHFRKILMVPYGIMKEKCVNCMFFRKICFGGCKGFYEPEQEVIDNNNQE